MFVRAEAQRRAAQCAAWWRGRGAAMRQSLRHSSSSSSSSVCTSRGNTPGTGRPVPGRCPPGYPGRGENLRP
eukprot:2193141-Heterocapsa_arctica.AAC.1